MTDLQKMLLAPFAALAIILFELPFLEFLQMDDITKFITVTLTAGITCAAIMPIHKLLGLLIGCIIGGLLSATYLVGWLPNPLEHFIYSLEEILSVPVVLALLIGVPYGIYKIIRFIFGGWTHILK